MAAIDRREPDAAAGADALASADFVRLTVAPSADAIAAAGILTRAFEADGRPYQARISEVPAESGADARLIDVGTRTTTDADGHLPPGAATPAAATLVESLGHEPDSALVAAARVYSDGPGEEASTLPRRAGVGTAVDELTDGLAHATLVHGPYSGSEGAAEAFLGELGADEPREVASAVSLATVADAPPAARAAETVERFLRPVVTPDGPFATAPGTADVLDILADEDPGLGLAIACGQESACPAALDIWRDVSNELHDRLRTAESARYSGLVVLRTDRGAAPLARLLRDVRSPEPTVAVSTETMAAVASTELSDEAIGRAIEGAVESQVFHGDGRVSGRLVGQVDDLVERLREDLA